MKNAVKFLILFTLIIGLASASSHAATQLQLRRGTTTEMNSFTGAEGELTYDKLLKRLRIHDGTTVGGFEIPKMLDSTNAAIRVGNSNMVVFDVRKYGAIPDDGIADQIAIQNAIEAAASSLSESTKTNVVFFPSGRYDIDPDNILYPNFTSENIKNVITIKSNNVALVGDSRFGARLVLMKGRNSNSEKVNLLGSGGGNSEASISRYGVTNVLISGMLFDANGFNSECTQIYNPTNWLIIDSAVANSGSGSDGWDIQGADLITFNNIGGFYCAENIMSFNGERSHCDGYLFLGGGKTGGDNGSIFQFTSEQTPFRNGLVIGGNQFIGRGNFGKFEDSYFYSTNVQSTFTNWTAANNGGGGLLTFRNCTFEMPNVAVTSGWLFGVGTGGALQLEDCRITSSKPVAFMAAGTLAIYNSFVTAQAGGTPIITEGGDITLIGNTLRTSSERDIRIRGSTATATVLRNNFMNGTHAPDFEGTTVGLFEGNYVAGGEMWISSTAMTIRNNNIYSLQIGGGTAHAIIDNYFRGTFTRSAGNGQMLGNQFASMTDAVAKEIGETTATFTSITPTATYTLWTNVTSYTAEVSYFGGAIEAVGKNGIQIQGGTTLSGNVVVPVGQWIGITNSSTSGETIRYIPVR